MHYQLIEELTRSFYEWEQLGRGWDVWEYPVELEPPFVPFSYHAPPRSISFDDGYRHTFLSSFVERMRNNFSESPHKPSDPTTAFQEDFPIVVPNQFSDNEVIKEIKVVLPQKYQPKLESFQQLFLTVTLGLSPISFEVIGTGESISLQFASRETETPNVIQQVGVFFPDCAISEHENSLYKLFTNQKDETIVVDFGLSEEFMRPLAIFETSDPDPLTSIFGVLDHLHAEELGLLQVLFTSAESPWVESIMRSVRDDNGDSFFIDAPEMVKLAFEKCQHPLFAVILRVVGRGITPQRSWEIVKLLANALNIYSDPCSNGLIPLNDFDYPQTKHIEDVILRQSHRSGMLLNSAELASLIHFPSPTIAAKKLARQYHKTIEVPSSVIGNQFVLGENIHQGHTAIVSLTHEQRLRHMHILGATGTGKTTLLLNLILQDIEHGLGVAVMDPHGDLIDLILERMSLNRCDDVIVFDPGDEGCILGFNILEAQSEIEKNILASDLVEILKRFSVSWGDRMNVVLGNAIATLLETKRANSLIELRRFLIEKAYREELLHEVDDQQLQSFWRKEFHSLEKTTVSSILTRLDSFLRPKVVRNIVSQPHGIDIKSLLHTQKILLIKLAQGIIGEENAYTLGSLLVAKMHQAVLQRQVEKREIRQPFYFYIDEFQNFVTPSMKSILSGARKYNFGLILAHQDLQQLWESNLPLANSLLSNAGTRVCFRIGDFDAQKLENGFSHFDRNDLQNLSIGEAIVRVERADHDFNMVTLPPLSIDTRAAMSNKETVISRSREKYGGLISPIKKDKDEPSAVIPPSPSLQKVPLSNEGKIISNERQIKIVELEPEHKNVSLHRYLQSLIKRFAEQRGYKATIEAPITNGAGRVDVVLERDGEKIACEISITTNNEHELKNIEKCMEAGFQKVLFCSPEKKRLEVLENLVSTTLDEHSRKNVIFLLPDGLFRFFEEESKTTTAEKKTSTVKGYRVKVAYADISDKRKKEKQEIVSSVIVNALRRLKKNTQ